MKRNSERMTVRANAKLVKAATVGLIGDGVETISHVELQNRVNAQAMRSGVLPPAWPATVDALRYVGYIIHPHHIELPLTVLRAPRPANGAATIGRNAQFNSAWASLQRALGSVLTHAHAECSAAVRDEYTNAVRHARAELGRLETISAKIG